MKTYNYKIQSSIGGRKEQQDFSGSSLTRFGLLVVVCDGMGGARGGATASRMAVEIIITEFKNTTYDNAARALTEAIQKANNEIFYRSRSDENCRGMGTTVTAIVLQDEKATVAYAGDSRVYQLRNTQLFGSRPSIVYRTFDHSKVFELVRRGIMSEEQARVSDDSNVILRALGIKQTIEVDVIDNLPYLKGDRFMLCTDGICGALPEEKLLDLLAVKGNVQATIDNLVTKVDDMGARNGGNHDNLTAAIIECTQNSILKTPLNMQSKITIISLAALLALSLGYTAFSQYQFSGLRHVQAADSARYDSLKKQYNKVEKALADTIQSAENKTKKLKGGDTRIHIRTEPAPGEIKNVHGDHQLPPSGSNPKKNQTQQVPVSGPDIKKKEAPGPSQGNPPSTPQNDPLKGAAPSTPPPGSPQNDPSTGVSPSTPPAGPQNKGETPARVPSKDRVPPKPSKPTELH